jgi:hypothetical protein
MKYSIIVILVLFAIINNAHAGYLRENNKKNNSNIINITKPSVRKGDVPTECDPFAENPCRKHKFITPDITEEKYYNRTSGLFLVHKLTSQEAKNVKAKVESGIEEVDPEAVKKGEAEEKKDAAAAAAAPSKKTNSDDGSSDTKNDVLKVAKEEEELKAKEARKSGLGKVEDFVQHNEKILKEHKGHKEKVNQRYSKTKEMIQSVKKQLETLRAKEDALTKEHRRYDIHMKIANLMKEKRDLDAKIQTHAAKLKVLDAERKQLDTQQKEQVVKLDGLKGHLDNVHLKIINLKRSLGLNGEGATGGIANAEANAEKKVEENAEKAIQNAGPKVAAEAKDMEKAATGSATGSETGSATGAATGSATGNSNNKNKIVKKSNGNGESENALATEMDEKIQATIAKLKKMER